MTTGFSLQHRVLIEETIRETPRGVLVVEREQKKYRTPWGAEEIRETLFVRRRENLKGAFSLQSGLAQRFENPEVRRRVLGNLGMKVQREGKNWTDVQIPVVLGLRRKQAMWPMRIRLREERVEIEAPPSLSENFNGKLQKAFPLIWLGIVDQLVGNPPGQASGESYYVHTDSHVLAISPWCDTLYAALAKERVGGLSGPLKPGTAVEVLRREVAPVEDLEHFIFSLGKGFRGGLVSSAEIQGVRKKEGMLLLPPHLGK